jgi:dUTP pyrophosphatase
MLADVHVAVKRVGPVEAPMPRYQTPLSSGMDLHAAVPEAVTIAPLGRLKVPTGLAFAIPPHWEGQVRPRSGIASKLGLTVLNAPGTIDSDYRGEVLVLLVNLSDHPATIQPLDRIAQIVFSPVGRAELHVIDDLEPTKRGDGGYGSTGI